jgi:hypothetical protein
MRCAKKRYGPQRKLKMDNVPGRALAGGGAVIAPVAALRGRLRRQRPE